MSSRGRRLLLFALFSVGCGASRKAEAPAEPGAGGYLAEQEPAAPPPAAAPAPAEEALSSTKDESGESSLEQAIAEFDRARLELSQLIGRDLGQATASAPPATAAGAPRAAEARAPADKASSRAEAEKAKPLKKGDDGCVNVCRAFESLTRSASAVCRLDDGERCRKANSVVSVAQDDAGVRACACKK